jgi:hypothetical protein
MIRASLAIAVCFAVLGAGTARALDLEQVGPEFAQPMYVTSDPGDAGRLFVVERKGTIRLVEDGKASLFTDISSVVACCTGERGLLSIALDPNFDANGRLYVDYTAKEPLGEIHVEEMTATGPGHDTASAASLRPLLAIPHSEATNHNGGQLQFGPEGDLYVSTGDGGGSNDAFHHAQDLASPLGKLLRVDPNPAGPAPFYTVPPSNPFAGVGGDYEPIWSYGLRNPYRFSFDRLSGAIAIGDVGQGAREEIDFAAAPWRGGGANYGWNCREGLLPGPATDLGCAGAPASKFVGPVFDYPHDSDPDLGGSSRCAIIGGYVARDPGLGALFGHYLYADLCSGAIRALQLPAQSSGLAIDDCYTGLSVSKPVSFGEDAAARLYLITEPGRVYRIGGSPPANCPAASPSPPGATSRFSFIGIHAQRRRVPRGKTAVLTVFVSPCGGRKGQSVRLLRNGHPNGTKFLDRACTARFLSRVRRGTSFVATVGEDGGFPAARSRSLRVRIAHHHRRR